MGALTKLETVTLPEDHAATFSLPPWLNNSLAAVQSMNGTPTIPESKALYEDQRSTVKSLVAAIDKRLGETDKRRTGAAVTALLFAYNLQDLSSAAAKAVAEDYDIALEGVPAWAVDGARRRWLQANLPPSLAGANLAFRPTPPQLRLLANAVMGPLSSQRYQLTRLLSARVEKEYSDEHRAHMLRRLADALRPAGVKPEDFAE